MKHNRTTLAFCLILVFAPTLGQADDSTQLPPATTPSTDRGYMIDLPESKELFNPPEQSPPPEQPVCSSDADGEGSKNEGDRFLCPANSAAPPPSENAPEKVG